MGFWSKMAVLGEKTQHAAAKPVFGAMLSFWLKNRPFYGSSNLFEPVGGSFFYSIFTGGGLIPAKMPLKGAFWPAKMTQNASFLLRSKMSLFLDSFLGQKSASRGLLTKFRCPNLGTKIGHF